MLSCVVTLYILDAVAPVIKFTNPSPSTSNSPKFTWQSSEQAVFKCSLDGAPFEYCGRGINGQWNKTNVKDGSHILRVTGEDSVQNVGIPAAHSWIIGKISKRIKY